MIGEAAVSCKWKKGVSFLLAMLATMLLAAAISAAAGWSSQAYADTQTLAYHQSDGYEPYQGWQDSPWDEASDPWYSSSGGTTRKGYPAWSLTDPLSKGVTGYQDGIVTGSSVTVLTDMGKTDTSGAGTYGDPYYYKNIILPSYDADAATLQFTLSYVGAGGVNPVYLFDGHGGLLVTKSDDPAEWSNPENVVWEGSSSNVSVLNTSDNWWKNIVCTVDAGKIDPDQIYYLVVKNGTAGQWARLYADIVFEFNTYKDKTLVWNGDEAKAGYGREQGNGGTKLGLIDPLPSDATTDLTKVTSCWYNRLSTSLILGDGGSASIAVHADGSGSNWQGLSTWTGACASKVNVYDTDPTVDGTFDASALAPVASSAAGTLGFSLVDPSRDWPSYDGVSVDMSGLEEGKTYYLVFSADLKPQTTRALEKPIVFEFTTASKVESWEIGKEAASDATAALYSDGQLVIKGTGDLKAYSSSEKPPWFASAFVEAVKSARFEGVSPTDISYYFYRCTNLEEVGALPESVQKMVCTFSYCESLAESPVLPAGVEDLNSCFIHCRSFKVAPAIPEGTKNLTSAFDSCTSLTSAPEIPSGAKTLDYMLSHCTSLTEAPAIPSNVASMGYMFNGCTSLTSAPEISVGVVSMDGAFFSCTALAAMPVVPDSVVSLNNTFEGCTSLKTVTVLPDSIESMAGTFSGCTALETAPALPGKVKTITGLFQDCQSLKAAPELPDTVEGSLFNTFKNCIALETGPSKIPAGVDAMWRCFQNCRSLKVAPSLTSGLTNMKEAFQNCASLTEAPVIPDTVITLQGAFQNCTGIMEAPVIPDNVTTISNAFSGCTALVRLPDNFVIPASVKTTTNAFKVNAPYSAANLLVTCTQSKDESLAKYNWAGSFRQLVVQDFSALNAGIDVAEAAASSVVVSVDGKDVPNGSKYVTADDMTAFAAAIAAAKAAAAEAAATQDDIDKAAQELAAAQGVFDAAARTAVADMAGLDNSVAAATVLKDSVIASADGNDVPAGKDWATEDQIAELAKAIADAQAVAGRTDATQNEADAAEAKIDAAMTAFTKNTAEPSTVALAASLATADAAAEPVTVSADGKDVAHGKAWCVQADADALGAARANAQNVLDAANQAKGLARAVTPDTVTQNDVNTAVADLDAAVQMFKAALRTSAVDTAALEAAVTSAQAGLQSVAVSKDGSDVLATKQWVKQEDADALSAALFSARAAAADASRTQNGVDAALTALNAAAADFDKAKRAGSVADTAVLEAAIAQAKEALAAATTAIAADQVAEGSFFVTQDDKDALQTVVDEAVALAGDPAAKQADVDALQAKLTKAIVAFEAAKQAGTKTESAAGGSSDATAPSSGGKAQTLVSTGDPLALAVPLVLAVAAAVLALVAFCRKADRAVARRKRS